MSSTVDKKCLNIQIVRKKRLKHTENLLIVIIKNITNTAVTAEWKIILIKNAGIRRTDTQTKQ